MYQCGICDTKIFNILEVYKKKYNKPKTPYKFELNVNQNLRKLYIFLKIDKLT